MRHTYIYIFAALAALMCSCSNIDPEDRLTEVPFLPEDLIVRNVLIEDFTGQKCPNCPTAAEVVEGLEHIYGEHVVAVSIHSGGLAIGTRLLTNFGQYLFDKLGDSNLPQPAVRVDRACSLLTGGPEVVNKLHGQVRGELQRSTPITLAATCTPAEGEEGTYDVTLHVSSTRTLDATLEVWAVEDGIVNSQIMPDGTRNSNYVHHSVLRSTITAEDGVPLTLTADNTQEVNQQFIADLAKWKVENMSLVAIVSLPGGEVMQAVKIPVVSK